jgi:hypothetical protein
MNFNDIKPKKDTTQLFFQTDWSEEEREFEESLPYFLKSIEEANPVVRRPKKGEEKNIEKTQEENEDELIIKSSSKSTQQGQAKIPRENQVTDDEFLADFFGEEQSASTAVPAEPEADAAPKPTTKAPEPVEEEDPFKASPASDFPPKEEQAPVAEGSDPLLEGFDVDLYNERVKPTIDRILSKIPAIDVDASRGLLPEYGLRLDIDRYREDPDKIADLMVKAQSFKDSVMTHIIALGQAKELVKRAMDFALTNGAQCSKGSNATKREAHVQFVASDLYERQAEVVALHGAYEKTFGALSSQSDLLSRLLTTHQDRMRGMFKSTSKETREFAPAEPESAPAAEEPAPMVEKAREVPHQSSQVSDDMAKLDDFDPSVKAKSDKFQKGEWDF